MIELLRKELDGVTAEAVTHELNSKLALEKIESENQNLLAEQRAQHLANDNDIENLIIQLRRVKNETAGPMRQNSVLRMQSNRQSVQQQVRSNYSRVGN